MDDLISRAALLKECAECQKTDPHFEERGWANHFINSAGEPSTEWYCVEDMIENAPAVDAVPVVRCRECKHSYENAKHIDVACEWSSDPDFYCAAGERRDDDGKATH